LRIKLRIFCASSIGRSWVDRKIKWSAEAATGCASTPNGSEAAAPPTNVMNSRRRIACPEGSGGADYSRVLQPAKWGCCITTNLTGECLITGHWSAPERCPLFTRKRTWISTVVMSAKYQKLP
jgi:hypothetical protein